MSPCENGILHTIKEKWILIVTWKTNSSFKYFPKSPPSTVVCRLTFGSEVHGKGLACTLSLYIL